MISTVAIVALILTLTGCWSYQGLDERIIVLGIAVDKDSLGGYYQLTFECADLNSVSKNNPPKAMLLETEGKTVFDAVRNTLERVANKLYFAHIEVLIISESIAREDGIRSIVDWFMRDLEPREDINVVIARTATSKELLTTKCINNNFVSSEMNLLIRNTKKYTSYTRQVQLQEAIDEIQSDGTNLVVPAFELADNNGTKTIQLNGCAIFKNDRLLEFMNSFDTRSYLYVVDEVNGGIIVTNTKELGDVSLEISSSKTKTKYAYDDKTNRVTMDIRVNLKVYLGERQYYDGKLSEDEIMQVEEAAEQTVRMQIIGVIQTMQRSVKSDIFMFGYKIYTKDPKLWRKLKKDGTKYFETMNFNVKTEVSVVNTGTIV